MIIISCVLYAIALFLLIFIAPTETQLGIIMNIPTMLEAIIAILIGNVFTIMWYLDGKFENFYRDANIKPKKKEPQETETDNSSGGGILNTIILYWNNWLITHPTFNFLRFWL